ncbi:ATP-binding SpoIIE family protein phosphatase [Streptomyces reniochalinae]|uniref:protein-serine/threonine phosphatase n=1 Tax=Streptomyces reniochalinae TaxID=2250578 RepID=A0A367EX13_9ACTN|nr:ATP-binding SpoIIE family protein phosphatase [Streptomyces reniochalinae]RCG22686.1 serine/threonine protein phosphatase [Streptomyces reniochalinae]
METERVTEHEKPAASSTAESTPPEPPGSPGRDAAGSAGEPPDGTGDARTTGGTGRGDEAAAPRGRDAVPSQPQPHPSQPPQHARPHAPQPATGAGQAAGARPGDAPAPAPGDSTDGSERSERERRGGDRLRFVGAATRRIARGVDLDETVLGLCRASVPAYSDAILVYLRDPLPVGDERPTGPFVLRLRRSDRIPDDPLTARALQAAQSVAPVTGTGTAGEATEHAGAHAGGPGLAFGMVSGMAAGVAGTTAAQLAEVRAGGPLAEVLRGVRPVFADSAAASAALPELLGPDRDVPAGNRAILAPLRGRRRVIGAAVFLRRPDRPAFEPDDLLIAAQLATHTALGVDKAVLYGREAYIADELQRTMLPDELPQPTGVQLASRYLPAAETARVGGDWYDAIPLPGSRVALVVGDVMGHSMTSAAIMGQLRTTAQTLAGLDLPPQEVLHHLDEQAQRLGSDRMATCLYAVYDPVAHRIVIANAGHPPPVMLHRGGRAEVLRIPAGAPIGVGGVDFEAVELDAPAGATLLLYTDGLVESRQRDVWTGIEHLREKLAATARLTRPGAAAPLEPLCDEVLDIVGPGDRDDDIALLAARFDGIAPSDVAYWFLDPRAQTARQARRLARRALARWGLEELSDAVELLVSEIVTNAVRYAERPITLRLLRTDMLRCEVGDDVPQLPRLRQARATDEGGRGLYLVNRLARRWGATRLSTGKVVWFELPCPEPTPEP